MENYLLLINKWYQSKCDGSCEHAYGFTLENIDNPGWSLKINGENNKKPFDVKKNHESEDNWLTISATEKSLKGYCGVLAFQELIEISLEWLEIDSS